MLLSHYREPRQRGTVPDATHAGRAANALCGDEVVLSLRVVAGRIEEARHEGVGCIVSQGGADVLCDAWRGTPLAEAAAMDASGVMAALGEAVPATRVACAMLPLQALQAARLLP